MRKPLLAAAVGLLALLGSAGPASATITSPATGGTVTQTGTIRFTDAITNTTCVLSLAGSVQTSLSVDITSGSATSCAAPLFTMTPGFNWLLQLNQTGGVLDGTFTIANVTITNTLPFSLVCRYQGSLSGTYTRGANAVLTIARHTLVRVAPSSAACGSNPNLTGPLTTNLTIV